MTRARTRAWAGRVLLGVAVGVGLVTLASGWWWVGVMWYPGMGASGVGVDVWLSGGNLKVNVVDWRGRSDVGGPRGIIAGRTDPESWWPRVSMAVGRRSSSVLGSGPPYALHVPVFVLTLPLAAWASWRLVRDRRGRAAHECQRCGYDLRGCARAVCPECGRSPR